MDVMMIFVCGFFFFTWYSWFFFLFYETFCFTWAVVVLVITLFAYRYFDYCSCYTISLFYSMNIWWNINYNIEPNRIPMDSQLDFTSRPTRDHWTFYDILIQFFTAPVLNVLYVAIGRLWVIKASMLNVLEVIAITTN